MANPSAIEPLAGFYREWEDNFISVPFLVDRPRPD